MRKCVRLSLVALLSVVSLCAQNATGRITGRVTDATGAVVPGANVKAVNLQTNVEASIKTTSEGNFELLNLIPGQYRLQVTMGGFKGYEQSPIDLHVGDTLTIAVPLQLGAQTESVTVNAEAPLLEAGSAELGQVVTTKQLENLPIPDSSALFMSMFAANLTTTSPLENGYDPSGRSKTLNINAAGAMQNQNMLTLDGMPDMFGNTAAANIPTSEMVQEVKVSVAAYDASVGHFTGALINVVMKSGTNSLHGSLTYHNNSTALNAIPYFTKVSLGSNPPETHEKVRALVPYILYNRYRGMVTGPVFIPKVYNGHNKTFFMFAADYFILPYSSNGFFTVPTVKERAGDFSDLLALGSNYQIYDPYSAKPAAGGHITRSPLAGNIIPPDKLNPVAQALLKYYPQPNLPGTVNGTNNRTGVPNSTINWKDVWTRVDQVIGPNHRLYFSFNMYRVLALQNRYFGALNGGIVPTGVIQNNHHNAGTVDDVINLSNAWVLNLRYGIIRFSSIQPSPNAGFDLSSLGMDPKLIGEIPRDLTTLPALTITGYQANGSNSGSKSYYTNQNFFASATHMRGNHSLKLGTELRVAQRTTYSFGNLTPAYTFGTSWMTASDTAAASPLGQGLASFLYGLPTDGLKSNNASYATTSKLFAWYVQDDWKVTRKLTVNLGIRQELEYPTTERYNRTNRGFDFADPNPVQAAAQANYALNPISQIPISQFELSLMADATRR